MPMTCACVVFLSFIHAAFGLSNGVARTPPMGWLSWQRFRCETDCTTYPDDCINAQLYEQMADSLVMDGWRDVGYTQINIDDCWSSKTRDSVTSEMVADPQRFPDGIKAVADYLHSLDLKLGLYTDIGSASCAGYPGVDGHYELDAETFASWEIDMLKVDGCNGDVSQYYETYPLLGNALNATWRPIIYSCSWPAYISGHGEKQPAVDNTTLKEIATNCNLWRNYADVEDTWESVQGIIEYWSRDYNNYSSDPLLSVAAPGQWNDPDMVIGGANGLSLSEATTQFALWAIFAAPLLLGNDLRSIDDEFRNLLQNEEIIAVNQDPMGKQGGVIYDKNNIQIFMRELTDDNAIAVVMFNNGNGGFGQYVQFTDEMVPNFVQAWSEEKSFKVRNLVNRTTLGVYDRSFQDLIEPSSVGMYKLTPV